MVNEDYELFEFAADIFSDNVLINKGLRIARGTTSVLLKLLNHPSVTVCVYGYVGRQVNAIAMKSDGMYKIAISTGALTHFFHWYEMWFHSPNMRVLFRGEQDNDDILIEKLYEYSITYIASHEFFHIMNGHCDIPENEEHLVSEKVDSSIEEQHFLSQVLEFDADRAAVRSCTYRLLKSGTNTDWIKEIGLFSFALYNVFLVFQSDSKAGFDNYMKHTFYIKDHPYDGIRFSYSFAFVMDILLQIYPIQVVRDCFGFPIVERLIEFEKQMLGATKVKNCLFSASYTYQGAQHMMNLNNAWNEVAERLKPYAHIALAEGEYIPAMRVFIDDNGNFYKAPEEEAKADD